MSTITIISKQTTASSCVSQALKLNVVQDIRLNHNLPDFKGLELSYFSGSAI